MSTTTWWIIGSFAWLLGLAAALALARASKRGDEGRSRILDPGCQTPEKEEKP